MSSGAEEEERHRKELASLDFSGLRFPSDNLTIGMLRRLRPDSFDKGCCGFLEYGRQQPAFFLDPHEQGHAADDLASLLWCERLVAAFAYATGKGIDGPSGWEIEGLRDELRQHYCNFGLASGPQHAWELIRDVERQGSSLGSEKGI
jgi:hypothetical protein